MELVVFLLHSVNLLFSSPCFALNPSASLRSAPPLKGEVAFAHVSEQKTEGLKREGGLFAHVSEQKTEGVLGEVERFSGKV